MKTTDSHINTNGLKRVILIDSYMKGVHVEAKVDGSTLVDGQNGKGKTSLLRLIPIFYGVNPSHLVRKNKEAKKSFTEYYLPRLGSYIVFEYRANNQTKMAIFTGVKNNTLQFRQILVDAPFDMSLFFDSEKNEFLPSSDVISRLDKMGANSLLPRTIQEYRSLLLTSKGGYFSLYSPGSHLTDLLPLLFSLFDKKVNVDDLSKIVHEWADDAMPSDAKKKLDDFTIDRDDINQWITDYRGLNALEDERETAEKIEELILSIATLEQKTAGIYRSASEKKNKLSQQYIRNNDRFEKYSISFKDQSEKHQDALRKMEEKSDSLNKRRRAEDNAYQNIHARYTNYVKKGVPEFAGKTTLQAAKNEERSRLTEKLSNALNSVKTLKGEFDRQRSRVESGFSLSLKQHTENVDKAVQASASKTRSVEYTFNDRLNKLSQHHDKQEMDYRLNEKRLIEECGAINASLQAAKNATPLMDKIKANHKRNDALDKELKKLREKEKELRDKLTGKEKLKRDHNEDLVRISRREEDSDKALRALIKRRGEPGSLIAFLRDEVPGWEETFGGALNDDALFSHQLSPQLTDGKDNSIFGITLDIDNLPSRMNDLNEIEQEISVKRDNLERIKKEKEKTESLITENGDSIKSLSRELAVNRIEISKRDSEKDENKSRLNDIERDSQKEKDATIASFLQSLEAKKADLELSSNSLSNFLLEKKKEVAALEEEKNSRLLEIEKEHAVQIEALDKVIALISSNRDKEINAIDEQEKNDFKGKGVDPATITSLREQIDTVDKELVSLSRDLDSYTVYLDFMDKEYPHLAQHEKERENLKQQINSISKERDSANQNYKEKEKAFNELKNKQEFDQKEINRQQKQLEDKILINKAASLIQLGDLDLVRQWDEVSPSRLTGYFEEYSLKITNQKNKLERDVDTVIDAFKLLGSQSVCYEYYREHLSKSIVDDAPVTTKGKAIISYYKDNHHGLAIESLNNRLNMYRNINSYRDYITKFSRKVSLFGNKINDKLEGNLKFESLSRLSVSLSFSPEDINFWEDIKSLAESHERWLDKDRDPYSLPDDDIFIAMNSFHSKLEASRMQFVYGNTAELWRQINFQFNVTENGNVKVVNNSSGLQDISSGGLSYLILIVTVVGFIDLHRGEDRLPFILPIDEIGQVDNNNKVILMDLLKERNIHLVAACPDLSFSVKRLFDYHYLFDRRNGQSFLIDRGGQEETVNPFRDQPVEVML